MSNSTLRKLGYGLLGSFLLCLGVLVAHVYAATHKEHPHPKQLSRIDFVEKTDSSEANEIKSFVRQIPGVESCYFNIPDGILVYTFDAETQTSENVFSLLQKSGPYKAKRYVVDPEMAATGCPALGKQDSFQGKFVRFIAGL